MEKCKTTTVGGNILVPVKVVDVHPIYPEALKGSGIAGVVTMDALIGPEGNVLDVRPVSSPHPALESAAIEAVRQWQYSTTLLNCTPTEVRMKVTTNFTVKP